MNVDPTALNQGFAEAVAVSGAGDDRDVSGACPIPGHGKMGARGEVRHDRLRGREYLALPTRAAPRAGGARWGRLIQGSRTSTLAAPREVTAVLATKPCGLAGAVAGIPHHDALALWKPAPHPCPEEPGQMRRCVRARPLGLSPCWAVV
jgi:hypothetical protein